MPISNLQAVRAVVNKPAEKALTKAIADNDRQRYHAGPATSEEDAGGYALVFLKWIQDVLDNEQKFARFKQLLRYPLPSSNLVDDAADQYSKAFEAEDRFRTMEFSDPALETDAADYLQSIHYEDFIKKTLFNQCLQAAAAIWVVDLPAIPNTEGYATPKPRILEAKDLTDIAIDSDGVVTHVVFKLSPLFDDQGEQIAERWAVLDDESYRVFIKRKGEPGPSFFFGNPHDLGRCPAGLIWHDRLSKKEPLRIQSPLHAELTRLDYYLAGWVFSQHADLGAAFPILWSFKKRCTYENEEGIQCKEGWVITPGVIKLDGTIERHESHKQCPVCSKEKPVGPGTHLRVPQPADKDAADLRTPAGYINSDPVLLEYNKTKVENMKREILESLTGDSGEVDQTAQPVNEDQVHARFESRKSVIMYWATNLERTEADILSVLLQLRYGDQFLSSALSYGTEFHLLSPGQAIADYEAARKAGLPTYQIMTRRERIDRLLAGASERTKMRHIILAQLEPYPDQPLTSVAAGSDMWELKANFSYYLSRFERENAPVELFGSATTLTKRIATITQTLYTYVSDDKARREVPQPPVTAGANQ